MADKDINFDSLFDITDENEKLRFEEMCLNSDIMAFIKSLMIEHNIETKEELANKLGITKNHLSKLFSSDKYLDIKLLAKLQRLFNVRFTISQI